MNKNALVVERRSGGYREGTWLRAVADRADDMNHVLLDGMIGKVVVTEWSHVICTAGISTMIHIVGRSHPYGHAWEALVPLEEQPSPDQLEISRQLCVDAAVQFQLRYGWRGYVQLGREALPEGKVRFEIVALLKKLPELWGAGRATDYRGNAKRLAKLLRALGSHPEGAALAFAAESIHAMSRTEPEQRVLDGIGSWLGTHPVAGERRDLS